MQSVAPQKLQDGGDVVVTCVKHYFFLTPRVAQSSVPLQTCCPTRCTCVWCLYQTFMCVCVRVLWTCARVSATARVNVQLNRLPTLSMRVYMCVCICVCLRVCTFERARVQSLTLYEYICRHISLHCPSHNSRPTHNVSTNDIASGFLLMCICKNSVRHVLSSFCLFLFSAWVKQTKGVYVNRLFPITLELLWCYKANGVAR